MASNVDIGLELAKKLKTVYDNDNFILGVLTYADNEEDQKKIIEFIDKGQDVDDETVMVLAMDLSDARNN